MKKEGPSKIKVLSLIVLAFVIMYAAYTYHNYYTYNSIKVVVKKNNKIEYGSANYNINDLIKKVDGEIVSVKNEVDTKVMGEQEILLEVKKSNVTKTIPIVVSIVDSTAPVININEEKVTIQQGDNYDLTYNVSSVIDEVDGEMYYNGEVDENSTMYYNFTYNQEEIDNVGEHEVVVNAKDKSGNLATKSFTLVVEERKYSMPVYSNALPNTYGNDVVSIAYSLIGSPYIAGSNGPYGFDCSGFVQYVYSRVGVYVSRSSWTQAYDGVGVSYQDAQPGDIISWGYSNGTPTHSALYVGNGMMVHATNPSQGVIASSVDGWLRGSGTTILSVRRIN